MTRRGVVVVVHAVERRFLLKAPPSPVLIEAGELRTARPEPAARRRIRRARQVALQQDPAAGPLARRSSIAEGRANWAPGGSKELERLLVSGGVVGV